MLLNEPNELKLDGQQKEQKERQQVVDIAHTWLRTPYHHAARLKGTGCDCITLMVGIYEEAGLIPPVKLPHYPHDWHLHRDAEHYLQGLMKYTHEIPDGEQSPGDIVVWRIGRCFSHGALVIGWPEIIHAQINLNVCLDNVETSPSLNFIGENTSERGKRRPRKFFSYWRR